MEGKGRKLKVSKVKKQTESTCCQRAGLQEIISESDKIKSGKT